MSAPDPEGMGLLAKIMGAAAAIITPLWGAHKWIDGRLEKKADASALQEMKGEVAIHRQYFKDMFQKLEEHQRRDEELFRNMMTTISDNHSEILRELGRKADR